MGLIHHALVLINLVARVCNAAAVESASAFARQESQQDIVTWDEDSLFVYGQRLLIYSGEFHPFRLPVVGQWLDVFQKTKSSGYNAVSFYIDWALLEGEQGSLRTDGIFALEPLFEAASEAGLYLIARPGPYINAEVSGDLYMRGVSEKIAAAQITNGGPVILIQAENEYSGSTNGVTFPDTDYMSYILDQFTSSGIVIPIVNNDIRPAGYFSPAFPEKFNNVTVDIYGHDSYPLGFDCGTDWSDNSIPTNFHALHLEQAPTTPYSLLEFQGGSFDPWGGPGFDGCLSKIGPEFQRVFYKNNWASGVKVYNQYMIYGGTNWGNLGHPGGYTSYDYASMIAEDRSVTREKYSDAKLQANFMAVSPSYLTSQPGNLSTDTYTDNSAIATTPLFGMEQDGMATSFYVVRHAAYNSKDETAYKLKVSTSVANFTLPQLDTFGTHLTLNGRDSKVHVTDYMMGGINLIYSTGEIFTWNKYNSSTVLVLYGGANEVHELTLSGHLGNASIVGSGVSTQDQDDTAVVQWQVKEEHQILSFDNLRVHLLSREEAYNWWSLELPSPRPVSKYSSVGKSRCIIRGAYLLRTAEISNEDLHLSGDFTETTELEVIGSPGYTNLYFNNGLLKTTATGYGTEKGSVSYESPNLVLPALSDLTWRVIDTLPELSPDYSDALWKAANLTQTNNPHQPDTPTVLYASDYGFHTGPLVYRGHFTTHSDNQSSLDTELLLHTQGGFAYGYQVYLNDTVVWNYSGDGDSESNNASIPLSGLKPATPYTLTVVIDHNGLRETPSSGSQDFKQPRGILSYDLQSYPQSAITWRLTGNLGGEQYRDHARGPLNEGGLYFERQGFHLPGAPTDSDEWTDVSGGPTTGFSGNGGAKYFAANFELDLPSNSYDIPLAFNFTGPGADAPSDIRCNLYVNGYQFGKYINNIGPQGLYPVPEGILNYNGDNYIGVYMWNLNDGNVTVKLGGFELVSSSTPAWAGNGQRSPVELSPMYSWSPRDGAY